MQSYLTHVHSENRSLINKINQGLAVVKNYILTVLELHVLLLIIPLFLNIEIILLPGQLMFIVPMAQFSSEYFMASNYEHFTTNTL